MEASLKLLMLLAAAAGVVKIGGGLLYGSKALFVDGLTSMANLVALLGIIYYHAVSRMPADSDHHFGHERLAYGGIALTLLAYSFVGGLAVSELLNTEPYRVMPLAPVYASIGLGLYLGVIWLSHRASWEFESYAFFTLSEVLESLAVIGASAAGSYYSYLIDYAGGVAVTTYLFAELYSSFRDFVAEISDITPPQRIFDEIRSMVLEEGLRVRELRLRMVTRDQCMGEATVTPGESMSVEEAIRAARRVEEKASRIRCRLAVRVCLFRDQG